MVAASSCVDGIWDSSCASAGISEPSKGVSVIGGTTSDGSPEGTMLLISETDGSAGKDTSGGIDDSEDRLCCAIMFGISASFGWLISGVGWAG